MVDLYYHPQIPQGDARGGAVSEWLFKHPDAGDARACQATLPFERVLLGKGLLKN
jgi:hypothetical protein